MSPPEANSYLASLSEMIQELTDIQNSILNNVEKINISYDRLDVIISNWTGLLQDDMSQVEQFNEPERSMIATSNLDAIVADVPVQKIQKETPKSTKGQNLWRSPRTTKKT